MTENKLPPDVLALYDQALASSEEGLAVLVRSFLLRRVVDKALGRTEEETVMDLVVGFENHASKELMASLLGTAVLHFARYWPEKTS